MLVSGAKKSIESVGLGEQHIAKIKASGNAFKILSSGIYSNKIRAVVRELACNAADAHTAAGTQSVPFLIHLPNTLEPWYSIRDYGTGLSHEDVIHLYTTYFESNKTKSNEFTGCLGLGSKSPLAYTDNFTVISYFGGVKRTYTWYMNEDDIPTISLVNEQECPEHDGLEVHLAVNAADFQTFRDEAEDVLKYFKYLPKVVGNKVNLDIGIMHSEPGFALVKPDKNEGWYAVMGNVSYPVDFSYSNGLGDIANWTREQGGILYYNIGDLDIAASREQLGYTDKTKRALRASLKGVETVLRDIVQTQIDQCADYVEACRVAHKLRSARFWMQQLKYKGQAIRSNAMLSFNVTKFTEGRRGGVSREQTTYISYLEGKYVIADVGPTSIARCRQAVTSSQDIYLIQPELLDKVVKESGLDKSEFINVSTLPYTPPNRTHNGQVFKGVYELQRGSYNSKTSWWDRNEQTVNDITGPYVLFNRYSAEGQGESYYLYEKLALLQVFDPKAKIYGIRPREEERAIDNGWIKWDDYRKETIENFVAAHKDEIAHYLEDVDNSHINQLLELGVDNELFNQLRAEQKKMTHKVTGNQMDRLPKLMEEFGITVEPATSRKELVEALHNRYPMLQCVSYMRDNAGYCVEYINQIDELHELKGN